MNKFIYNSEKIKEYENQFRKIKRNKDFVRFI